MLAGDEVPALIRFEELPLDPGQTFDLGCRDEQHLAAVLEIHGPALQQVHRVTLPIHVGWPGLDFIAHGIADAFRPEGGRRPGAGEHQIPAAEVLADGAVALPRLLAASPPGLPGRRRRHQGLQGRRRVNDLVYSRDDLIPRLAERFLHQQHAAGRVLHDVADPGVPHLGRADARSLHEHDFLDPRGGRQAVHRLPQIGPPARAPRTRLRRGQGQDAVGVGPFGDGQGRLRAEALPPGPLDRFQVAQGDRIVRHGRSALGRPEIDLRQRERLEVRADVPAQHLVQEAAVEGQLRILLAQLSAAGEYSPDVAAENSPG